MEPIEATERADGNEGNRALPGFQGLVGQSAPMHALFASIKATADAEEPVLILGETGTGKELVAQAIHDVSPRSRKPFGTLHCGLLRPDLLRSELFGHRKGAFTGALSTQTGLLTRVHEGTAFLDEVGDLLPEGQLALLRFLDSGEVLPIGDETPSHSGARIVAATNRPLRAAIRAGHFREDLYYRLNVAILRVPPLRARLDDLPLLIEHARRKAEERYGPAVGAPSPEALDWLASRPWPGNVRELFALLRRAWMHRRRGTLELEHLVAAEAEDDPAEDGTPAETEDRRPPTRVALGAEASAVSGVGSPSSPRAVALALVQRDGVLTRGHLARAAGISGEHARRALVALAGDRLLRRVGAGRATRYVPAAATAEAPQ